MLSLTIYFLLTLIFLGTVPILVLLSQFFIAGLHGIRNHYSKCKPYLPRVAILIPAWNEEEVIGYTLDKLLDMDYPHDALRAYVIDDGSTDNTGVIAKDWASRYPNNIFHIRLEHGGQGKAHTLNAGLKQVLTDDWAQAIMIIDADIVFQKDTLRKMTRHLADPKVGGVTAYIEVEQTKPNFLTNCIASEYILSQAIARRAQNVTDALACMAGGAQLHTRANIEAIGGQINTSTLAEDTYTTFLTQINHRRAIFEGNTIVKAEEPEDLLSFWKQRFRWSRGNIQITRAFKHLWFRTKHTSNLGGIFFGLTWFSTLLMPFAMIITSISLILLFFIDPTRAWTLFRVVYSISAVSYIFSTLLSFAIDPVTIKRAWFSTLMFPGLISLCMIILSIAPNYFSSFIPTSTSYSSFTWGDALLLFMDAWVALCMFFSWVIYRLAIAGFPKKLILILLIIVGYGPLLCTITLLAFFAELRRSNLVWNKTEKKLKIRENKITSYHPLSFDQTLAKDIRAEHELIISEILIIIFMITFFMLIKVVYYNL